MHELSRRIPVIAFLAFLLSACGVLERPPAFPDAEDGFEQVTFVREYRDCLRAGQLSRAVVNLSDGDMVYTGSIVRDVDPQSDDCPKENPAGTNECLVSQSTGDITLTDAQETELRDRVTAIRQKNCRRKRRRDCRYCPTYLEVDGERVSSYCCGNLNEGFSDNYQAVVEFMQQFAP